MRHDGISTTALILLSAMALAVSAATPTNLRAQAQQPAQQPASGAQVSNLPVVTEQKPSDLRANTVIGMRVRGAQDEDVGKIYDLVLDNNGQVSAAVIVMGGVMGIGGKTVGLPWSKLRFAADEKTVLLDISRDDLAKAPDFRTKEAIAAEQTSEQMRKQLPPRSDLPGTQRRGPVQ